MIDSDSPPNKRKEGKKEALVSSGRLVPVSTIVFAPVCADFTNVAYYSPLADMMLVGLLAESLC